MLNSIFESKKKASWTLPGGLLSASCNINKNFGAYVGLQVGPKFPTIFERKPSFVEFQHKYHLKTILRGFWKGFGKDFEVVLGKIFDEILYASRVPTSLFRDLHLQYKRDNEQH